MNKNNVEKIVEENAVMLMKIAKKYKKYDDMEALMQIGMIGILKTLQQEKEMDSEEFSVYASIKFEMEIQDYLNQKDSFINEVSSLQPQREESLIKTLISNLSLSELHKNIATLRYSLEKTQNEVSEMLKIPVEKVREIEREVLRKIKGKINS